MSSTATRIDLSMRALYGEPSPTALARDLGVQRFTVQRWATGQHTPPPETWTQLADLMRARAAELGTAAAIVEADPPAQRKPGRQPRAS